MITSRFMLLKKMLSIIEGPPVQIEMCEETLPVSEVFVHSCKDHWDFVKDNLHFEIGIDIQVVFN